VNIGLYEGAAALSTLEQWQNTVAHNLANAPVPGFKGQGLAIQGVRMGQIPTMTDSTFEQYLVGQAPKNASQLDFSDGELVRTGESTHVAIQGDGFFELEAGRGKTVYTRDGAFHIDADNFLVNRNGIQVSGESGPISLPASGGEVTIDEEGNVLQNGNVINRLVLTRIDGKEQLTQVPGGFIIAGGANIDVEPVEDRRLAPGFYEGSNVQVIDQMVRMIELSRAYESNQKVINAFDSQKAEAIRSLGGGSG